MGERGERDGVGLEAFHQNAFSAPVQDAPPVQEVVPVMGGGGQPTTARVTPGDLASAIEDAYAALGGAGSADEAVAEARRVLERVGAGEGEGAEGPDPEAYGRTDVMIAEREACAVIADIMGAPAVAAKIREREPSWTAPRGSVAVAAQLMRSAMRAAEGFAAGVRADAFRLGYQAACEAERLRQPIAAYPIGISFRDAVRWWEGVMQWAKEQRRIAAASEARGRAMTDPVFAEGFRVTTEAGETSGSWPENPHIAGSPEAARWALGAEQARLEGESPDSWRDGGAGMDEGVMREVAAGEGVAIALLDNPRDIEIVHGGESRAAACESIDVMGGGWKHVGEGGMPAREELYELALRDPKAFVARMGPEGMEALWRAKRRGTTESRLELAHRIERLSDELRVLRARERMGAVDHNRSRAAVAEAEIERRLACHVGEAEARSFIADHGVGRALVWARALEGHGSTVRTEPKKP